MNPKEAAYMAHLDRKNMPTPKKNNSMITIYKEDVNNELHPNLWNE